MKDCDRGMAGYRTVGLDGGEFASISEVRILQIVEISDWTLKWIRSMVLANGIGFG